MKRKPVHRILLSSVLSLAAFGAQAVNLVEMNEGKSTMVQISMTQPTLIRGQGMKLRELTVADTAASVSKDSTGNAVLTPMSMEPFTVFVTMDTGEVANLLLVPRKIPGDSIVINRPAAAQTRVIQNEMEYTQALKYMLFVTATGDEVSGITRKNIGKDVQLWREVKFVHQATHEARDIIGNRYSLTNVTDQPLVVKEQEFYRHGTLGVSLAKHTLQPGETTNVYILVKAGG